MRWSIAIVACVACGGSSGSTGGSSLADYAADALAARCQVQVRCGLFADQASCTIHYRAPADPNLQAAVSAGKLAYDGVKAQQCFDAIAAVSCDATDMSERVEPAACKQIFTGKVQQGAACAFDDECASGVCLIPGCNNACCPGQCGPAEPPAQIGASCANVMCVDNAYCDLTQTCRALVAQGGACMDSSWCNFGLGCTGTTGGGMGTCNPLPATGAPCPDQQCASIGDVCNAQQMCAVDGLPGAPCIGSGECSPFYQCDATNHCAPYPTLGQACTTVCSDDSWCMNGTCTAPLANGMTCATQDQCASDFCDNTTGKCADLPMCI